MAAIGIDATSISVTGKGVSRYQHNLIKALAKLDKRNCYYVFLDKKNILPELPRQSNFYYVRLGLLNHISWDQFQLPRILKEYKLDIYHTTSDSLPILVKTKIALFIFEIPDYRINLISARAGNSLYSKISYGYSKIIFPHSLRKAAVIMCGSYSTKTDLIKKYAAEENKIEVLYPGISECFRAPGDDAALKDIRRKYNADSGYILHISSSDPRDNTAAVIRAFGKTHQELGISQKLIIAGNVDPKVSGLEKLILELNLRDRIVFAGYFSENQTGELAALYQAADLYVDPSLYEGFGFQVAEALACGVPVIASNVTSLPEIIADAGILVNPKDENGLAGAIARALTDTGLRESMRRRGLEQAKTFSWEKTARQTLEIYNKLLLN